MGVHRLRRPRAAGLSIVEVILAAAILIVILGSVLGTLMSQAGQVVEQAGTSHARGTLAGVLDRLEQELAYAQAGSPSAWLSVDLAPGDDTIAVGATQAFPDQGVLVVGYGTLSEERVEYATNDAGASAFADVVRGNPQHFHGEGASVVLARHGQALPLGPGGEDPPAFDGIAAEIEGPTHFRGDGTVFVFRAPTAAGGGSDFMAGGELSLGATIRGQASVTGWSAFYFEPVAALVEANRGLDVNRDGDRADVFDLGRLRWRSWDGADPGAGASDVALSPAMVLQERGNWGADLDGDGFQDPLFLWNPDVASVHVRLTAVAGRTGGRTLLERKEMEVHLRNGSFD